MRTSGGVSMEEVLPNIDSVLEIYATAAESFEGRTFSTEELAAVRLGERASRPALDSEGGTVYQLLRLAAMYGLVRWYGGNKWDVVAAPTEEEEAWSAAAEKRSSRLRALASELFDERQKAIKQKVSETQELEGNVYLQSFVGQASSSRRMDSYVYNAWDPKGHHGLVLKSMGRNIATPRAIADELTRFAVEEGGAFIYDPVKEDIYRNDEGILCCDVFLHIRLA